MSDSLILPPNWTHTEVIYYDKIENYSLLWGIYEGFECLGICWQNDKNPTEENNFMGIVKIPLYLEVIILKKIYLSELSICNKNKEGILYHSLIYNVIKKRL